MDPRDIYWVEPLRLNPSTEPMSAITDFPPCDAQLTSRPSFSPHSSAEAISTFAHLCKAGGPEFTIDDERIKSRLDRGCARERRGTLNAQLEAEAVPAVQCAALRAPARRVAREPTMTPSCKTKVRLKVSKLRAQTF